MKSHTAEERLRDLIRAAGTDLGVLTPSAGIKVMLDFYRDERAEDCLIITDGDMLLYQ